MSQICKSGQNANARAVERELGDPDKTPRKEIQSVWAMTLGSSPRSQHTALGVIFCIRLWIRELKKRFPMLTGDLWVNLL